MTCLLNSAIHCDIAKWIKIINRYRNEIYEEKKPPMYVRVYARSVEILHTDVQHMHKYIYTINVIYKSLV